jgi:hypothetical protein
MGNVDLGQYFQKRPYNFDVPPPGYEIGPLTAVKDQAENAINDMEGQAANLLQQLSVQTATGVYLNAHGVLYGVIRFSGEADTPFRARILAVLKTGKCTLAAIQAAVVNYYASVLPPSSPQPVIYVFDLRSDPVRAEADGLQILDFEINIAFEYLADDYFFLDYSYLDYNTYLASETGSIDPSDPLALVLQNVKAAGTHPVYVVTIIYV